MSFQKVDHVAIAVQDLNQAIETYSSLLGKEPEHIEEVEEQKVRAAFFGVGETNLELLFPTAESSPIAKFLEKNPRGGLHHICLEVRNIEAHLAELKEHGLAPIDLVVVNLYPFQQTVAQPDVAEADAIEQIDIGGVALLRAAAKNFESVAVVCDPEDYGAVAAAMESGELAPSFRRELALKAFCHTAEYDTAIATYLTHQTGMQTPNVLPAKMQISLEQAQIMRYGENPHQQGG